MTDKRKKILKLAIRILVTSGLLICVFYRVERQQLAEALKAARWHYLIVVWALMVVIYWITSIKLRIILKKQGCILNTLTIFGVSAITAMYSLIMPGMLSMGMKWYILRKGTGKGIKVFSGMVYNQLSTIIIMMIFGLGALILTNPAAVIFTNKENHHLLPIISGILLVVIVFMCLLLLNSRTGGKIIKGISCLLKPFPLKIRQKGEEILGQFAIFQTVGWKFHLVILLMIIVGTLSCGIVIFIFAAKAANIIVSPVVLIWLWAIVYILERVPISIANLGVREATLAGLLSIYGVEPSTAVLMSMVLFSALIFMAIIGAFFNFSGFLTGVRSDEAV